MRANQDFRRLWIGQAASELGSSISSIALPLLVLAVTHSAVLTGLTGTLTFAVSWLFQLPAGYVADSFDRRKIMLVCDGIRGLAQSVLVVAILAHVASAELILILLVISSAAWTFFGPAQVRAIRTIVQRDQITEATAVSAARGYAADLVGPFLSGLLFTVSRFIPFLADAVSFGISAGSVTRIRGDLGRNEPRRPGTVLADVRRGWSYTWRHPFLRSSTLYSTGSNFVATALIFAIILTGGSHAGSGTPIGTAISIAAAGGVVGAAIAPKVQRRFGVRQILLFTGIARVILIASFALSGQPLILGALLAGFIMLSPTASTALAAIKNKNVPAEILGKVTASSSFVATGLQPLAPLTAGLMLAMVGRPATAVILGSLMLVIVGYVSVAAGFRRDVFENEDSRLADVAVRLPALAERGPQLVLLLD